MSNDGNKSTRRVPFTMFSSSADGGYLEDFHTNFTGGVTVANMHTDTYGEFRNPPMQGPFTNEFVGGESFRHQAVGTTTDREEGFEIVASSEQLIITEPTKKPIFRDAFAKRPLNIRNIKENSFGNYEQEYEVIQIAGRTLNPRHYAEYPEQYTTDFAQNFGTEGRVLNDIGADGVAATGSLVAYTLPDNTGSANNFVFVNKFSAPGDRYTMSRGFLNPKGEEMSVYNASPFRNLNVRSELTNLQHNHVAQFGYATNDQGETTTSGSIYQVNRNPDIFMPESLLPTKTSRYLEGEASTLISYTQGDSSTHNDWVTSAAMDKIKGKIFFWVNKNFLPKPLAPSAGLVSQQADLFSGSLGFSTLSIDQLWPGDADPYLNNAGRYNIYSTALDTTNEYVYYTVYLESSTAPNYEGKAASANISYLMRMDYDGNTATGNGGDVKDTTYIAMSYALMGVEAGEIRTLQYNATDGKLYHTQNCHGDLGASEKDNFIKFRYYSGLPAAHDPYEICTISGSQVIDGISYEGVIAPRSLLLDEPNGKAYLSVTMEKTPGTIGTFSPGINLIYRINDLTAGSEDYDIVYKKPAPDSSGTIQTAAADSFASFCGIYDCTGSSDRLMVFFQNDLPGKVHTLPISGEMSSSVIWAPDDQSLQLFNATETASDESIYYSNTLNNPLITGSITSSIQPTPWGQTGFLSGSTLYYFNSGDEWRSMPLLESDVSKTYSTYAPTSSIFEQYDNYFVQHAIPQTDIQYTWITASAESKAVDFRGNQTGSSEIIFYSNSVGFSSPMNDVYIDPDTATQSFDFTGSVYTYGTWKEIRGGELALSRYYRNNNILPVANNKDSVTQYIEPPVVSKNQPLEYIMAIDKTGAPFSIKSAYGSSLQRYSNKEINKLYNTDVSDSNTEYAKMKPLYLEKSVTDPNNPVKQFYSLNYGETVFPQSKNTYMSKVRVRGNYTEVAGSGSRGYDRLYGTQNTFYSATTKRTSGAKNSQGFSDSSLAFDPMRTDGSDSFPMSGLSSTLNVGEVNFNSAASLTSKVSARPSLDYSEANSILVGTTNSDYTERLVEQMSGKKRWYDSYSDYEENIRGLLKDASILPEFRVSEHMDYYVDTSAGNFRAENKKFLTLLGAEYSSSADSRTSNTFDVNFEDTYLDTENIKNLEKIRQDHIGYASPKKLTIKASGIKKLLHYNGFYPDTRTVQLGNLLSQSLADNISGYLFDPASPSKAEAFLSSSSTHGYAAVLKTLASPGILYNSTKAGLAVDYPIYSSTPDLKTYDFNPTNQAVISSSSQPTKRLPFETLVNFNENLPKDEKIFLVATSPSGSTLSGSKNYYAKWNGIKKPNFEIAAHNYLAESVNFFLEGGQLNTFTSKPQLQFAEVEANKNYYMDVVLRDEAKMNRFVEYTNMSASFPTYEVVDQQLGLSTLSGSELATSTAVAASGAYGAYVLFGVPTENKAVLAHIDQSGFARDISVDSDGNPILTGSLNSDARYGESVAMISGSDGNVHFVIGAPKEERATNFTGSVSHYYASTTPSSSVITYDTSLFGGTAGTSNFGSSVDIAPGIDGRVFYTGCGQIAGGNVSVRLGAWNPITLTSSFAGISVPDMSSSAGINRVAIASGSTDLYVGLTSTHVSGAASSGLTVLNCPLTSFTFAESAHEDLGSEDAMCISATSPAEFAGPNTSTYDDNCFFTVGLSDDNYAAEMKIFRHNPAVTTAYRLYSTAQVNSFNAGYSTGFGAFNGSVIYDGSSYTYDLAVAAPFRASEDIPYGAQTETGQPKQVALMRFELPNLSTSTGNATMTSVEYLDPKPGEFAETPFSFGQGVSIDQNSGNPVIACGQPLYNNSAGNVQLLYRAPRRNRYSQNGKLFGVPTEGQFDPAYCAYTPPGFYGESVATIAFSSSIGGEVSLDEIIRTARVTETQTAKEGSTSVLGGESTPLNAAQQDVKMNVGSSVTLFAKSEQPDLQFEIGEDGEAVRVDRATTGGANNIRWAISTKYETPVIDVSSSAYEENYTSHVAGLENSTAWMSASLGGEGYSLPRSSWTSYGQQTTPEKGYYFDVRESTSKTSADGSLIDLCGFTPGTKKVGSVADNKVITEAIMVIPYTDRAISRKTTEIEEGKHFFRGNRAELKRQNKSLDNNGYAVSEEIPETSIAEMINGMKDYVIPPQYNFMQYKDIKPFAAYFLEFTHTLSQRDLIDIWQGVTPSIALSPETEDVEISHNFDKHNLFHNIDIPADMKFMVFKVKKKANWNYYTITADSTDDDRFKFDFQGDGQVEVVPDYNYNWPYDFFTLVERAKVDVTVSLEKDNEPEENE